MEPTKETLPKKRVAPAAHLGVSAGYSGISLSPPVQKKQNETGLPDELKDGAESLSEISLDDVKVHYNSSKPAQLNAHAYAKGADIHVGPGQEKHLPHEAWHVVQQKQGRVRPTRKLDGVPVNDDTSLESEADRIGSKINTANKNKTQRPTQLTNTMTIQVAEYLIQLKPMVTGEFVDPTPSEGEVLNAEGNPLKSPMFSPAARFDLIEENQESKYEYGEYRQYVKGAFRSRGIAGEHWLKTGIMSEDKWKEDRVGNNRYGYRSRSQGIFTTDEGNIDKKLGRHYISTDQPSADKDDDEMDLHFKGVLVDTGDGNREIVERKWHVYGKK